MTYDEQREALIAYLLAKVEVADWHGVSDAANDIRVLEAQKQVTAPLPSQPSDNLSRLRDLATKLDRSLPLPGMFNPDAETCRYAANELQRRRHQVAKLQQRLADCERTLRVNDPGQTSEYWVRGE